MEKLPAQEEIRRGIDFSARMGNNLAQNLEEKFAWWGGSDWNNATLIFPVLVFFINLIIIYPIFTHNLSSSYSSSALLTLAYIAQSINFLTTAQFLLFITMFALLVTPLSIYFFIRKNSGHDLTALLATLLFILPNPFLKQGMPLLGALLSGDGAHVVAFTFLPLILLLVQAFLSEGLSIYGVVAAILTAGVAIISPFSAFNLIILFGLLLLTEGFLGHIRVKFARLSFLLTTSLALISFWYFPDLFNKISSLDHITLTFNRIASSLPVAIPAIPIFGTVSFLIFDRRAKLKPVFLSGSILLYFYLLYSVSTKIHISGIFTAQRYVSGLTLGAAFFLAVIFVPLIELFIRNYILKANKIFICVLLTLSIFILIHFAGSGLLTIQATQEKVIHTSLKNQTNKGVGSLGRNGGSSIASSVATGVTFATLLLFIFILIRFPRFLH